MSGVNPLFAFVNKYVQRLQIIRIFPRLAAENF